MFKSVGKVNHRFQSWWNICHSSFWISLLCTKNICCQC